MRAIKKNDLENITYYQTPKWLFDLLKKGEITPGAFATYILMYDRTRLSAKNGWIDKEGDVYIKYSYEEMLQDLEVKSRTQIQRNLNKLESLNLIEKKRNYSSSTTFYLNIYSSTQNVSISSTQNVSISSTQNVSISSTQIVDASKNNISKNNISKNNINNNNETTIVEKFSFLNELSSNLKNKIFEFIEFRKEIKKPLKTERSIKSLLDKIGKEFIDEEHLIKSIDNSINNEYQGVFPTKFQKNEKSAAEIKLRKYL